jgi:methylenetetrahydrofolate dehydrogenase (NADP+)/methenyltetrahydrofolate cyclohydrolase
LAVVLVGDDPASATYVRNKRKACADCGIESIGHELPATTAQGELLALVRSLNARRDVDGILVPVAAAEGARVGEVIDAIDPPRTSTACTDQPGPSRLRDARPASLHAARRDASARDGRRRAEGRRAVVVGRSNLVGKPVAFLLLERHATVTICHSRTRDLAGEVRSADVRHRRDRSAALHPGRLDQARRGRHRRRHQPHRRRQAGRRRRFRRRAASAPRRSRRCRAAWGR